MDAVKERNNKGVKYFYNNSKVYSYCKEEMLCYSSVTSSIRYYQKKYENLDLDKTINFVIKKHLNLKNKKRIINFIKWMEKTNTYRFVEITEVLNIEFASLNKLYKKGFSKKEAFNIVWFLSDKKNRNGKLAISNKQIKKFTNLYYDKNYDGNTDFIYLFVLYRLGNNDVLNYIPEKRAKIIEKIIYQETKKFSVNIRNQIKNDIDDLKQDIYLKEYTYLYKNICLNGINAILRYLEIYARYYVIRDANKKLETSSISLDYVDDTGRCGYDYLTKYNDWS